MKKVKRLYSDFKPERYELYLEPNREAATFSGRVTITGRKTGRPSQRITLHQKDLKVTDAKVIQQSHNANAAHTIERINHLASVQEVRLHTNDVLRPGHYSIEVIYDLSPEKARTIQKSPPGKLGRELMPSIDEPEAWAEAVFEVKQ